MTELGPTTGGVGDFEAAFKEARGPLIEKLYGLGAMAAVIGVGFALVAFVVVLTDGPARPLAMTAAVLVVVGWGFAAAMNALMRARFINRVKKAGVEADAARSAWREFRAVED